MKLHIKLPIFCMFITFFSCICLLVGCENSKQDITAEISSKPTAESSSDIPSSQTAKLPSEAKDNENEEHSALPEKETNIPVSLKYARPFSEGIAWVAYEDQYGDEQIGWLHMDGHIDQPFPSELITIAGENYSISNLGSNFSDGFSYITTGDAFIRGSSKNPDVFLILNREGKITAQSPDNGSSYEILCGGNGVYLVKQSVRSMTEKKDLYGFISGDGEWLYECSLCEQGNNHPLSNTEGRSTMNEIAFGYLGDGIFGAVYSRGEGNNYQKLQTVLYNVKSGKTYRLSANIDLCGTFIDGIMPIRIDGQLNMIDSDFKLFPISVSTTDLVIYSDGILFTANRNYSGNRGSWLTEGKFYRTDGSVLVDLSQYELLYRDAYELYRYIDGYAAIVVCGVDGCKYLEIIDLEGNFTFEPKEISVPSNRDEIGSFSSGVIVVNLKSENAGVRIIDVAGKEVESNYIDWHYLNNYVFQDGYAFDKEKIYYIGVNGNLLETYVES